MYQAQKWQVGEPKSTQSFVLIDVAIVKAEECMRGMEEPGWEDEREQQRPDGRM